MNQTANVFKISDLRDDRLAKMAQTAFGQIGSLAKSLSAMQRDLAALEADARDNLRRLQKLERSP
jgi:hypothetical protein